MKRTLFLTSSGLSDSMKELLLNKCGKSFDELRILLVPTAGIETDAAREGLAVCLDEFERMGIRNENILVYNLELIPSKTYKRTYSSYVSNPSIISRLITLEETKSYDAIFVSGGDASVLSREMSRTGFSHILKDAVNEGLIYIGISAGSMFAAGNLDDGLHIIPNRIVPHWDGNKINNLPEKLEDILLADGQAVYIEDDHYSLL
ncbi:MAG: Type 1 glutamine amidotransferase-like domain-containing protein [Lachnospiraceae bacterium]|nr:Type 1 glutamine amidotransferase-like domain-containing protein [Lachnospiraceae bacterium]